MIRSLLWKEWHEQWWRIAFGCVMTGAFTAIGLDVRIVEDVVIIIFSATFGALIMPLLMVMGLIAPEHADRTMPTLISLPIAPWKTLAVKLLVGTLGCLLPMATAALLAADIAGGREMELRQIHIVYTGASAFAFVLLLWMTAFSVTQPTEAHVGLVGITVFFSCSLAMWFIRFIGDIPIATNLFYFANPLAIMAITTDLAKRNVNLFDYHYGITLLCAQSVMVTLLLAWMAQRAKKLGSVQP